MTSPGSIASHREPAGGAARDVCVVLHDVAPGTWAPCQRVLRAVEAIAPIPVTLLAVPKYHGEARDREFEAWLAARAAAGDEAALHGFTHRDDGVPRNWVDRLRRQHYTRGEGEFSDLSPHEALHRIEAGVRWFQELRLDLHGFVAPAWLLGPGAWAALQSRPFDYTCTLRTIVLLPEHRRVVSQSLVYSNSRAWRRGLSCAWVPSLARAQAANPVLRLELHPHDADHPQILRSWQALLARLLEDRRALTLANFVRSQRDLPERANVRADVRPRQATAE